MVINWWFLIGISEKWDLRLLVAPETRESSLSWDPRPDTWDPSHKWDPGPENRDPSHGWKPGPQTIKVGLNTISIYGTRDPRTRTLNMNECMCFIHLCLFRMFLITLSYGIMSYSFPVIVKTSSKQLLWNV